MTDPEIAQLGEDLFDWLGDRGATPHEAITVMAFGIAVAIRGLAQANDKPPDHAVELTKRMIDAFVSNPLQIRGVPQ